MEKSEFKMSVDSVKSKIDIGEVIGKYIHLDRYNKARCPFHKDNNPSFSVNPKGQYFYCFGCGVGGDVIKFIQLYEKIPFIESLKKCADTAGISVPKISSVDIKKTKEQEEICVILRETVQYYRKDIPEEVKEYLVSKRGFGDKEVIDFQIGYASGGLRAHLIEKLGYSIGKCLKAGVLKENEDGRILDFFYKRITFPNIKNGEVVNITGRAFYKSNSKYLNKPGKITHLYNEKALHSDEIFLTESITDCITLHKYGYASVATLGALNFKKQHIDKINKCTTNYLCTH